MAVELRVPSVGESITTVVVGEWLVRPGQHVERDQTVVVLETDKVNVEVPAPVSGQLQKVLKQAGEAAAVGEVLGLLSEQASDPGAAPAPPPAASSAPAAASAPVASDGREPSPAAQRALAQTGRDPASIQGTGKAGQILKEDVLKGASPPPSHPASAPAAPAPGPRQEEVVPLGPLRQTIARRLVEAQQTAALLTTFNEVDMSAVMELRERYQADFQSRHNVKLGFMSFFVKACVEALKAFPAVNAELRGNSVVFKNYYDIGVAVGGGKGLVVPILRNVEGLGLAEIEKAIKDFAARAQQSKLKLDELQGGTFTISNGGVYGSLLSTPIINPPQSGVLGLHKIMDRPIALDGQVVIRPMMYLALTYDHRLVDGREAVSFLIRIKQCVESPARILLEV